MKTNSSKEFVDGLNGLTSSSNSKSYQDGLLIHFEIKGYGDGLKGHDKKNISNSIYQNIYDQNYHTGFLTYWKNKGIIDGEKFKNNLHEYNLDPEFQKQYTIGFDEGFKTYTTTITEDGFHDGYNHHEPPIKYSKFNSFYNKGYMKGLKESLKASELYNVQK